MVCTLLCLCVGERSRTGGEISKKEQVHQHKIDQKSAVEKKRTTENVLFCEVNQK